LAIFTTSASLMLLPALYLLAPIITGIPTLPFWGVLLVLVAVSVAAWRSGLRFVRQKQEKVVRIAGAVVLLVALASSLVAYCCS
jgi:hypothetical protein